MPGPPKKEASLVARRNKPASKTVLKPQDRPTVPTLPTGTRWYPQVREWWKRAWTSPMATQWADADRDAMFLALMLQQQFWDPETSPSTRNQTAAQLRAIFDQCGLTPMARKRLGWEIETPDPAASTSGSRKTAPAKKTAAAKPDDDPRRRRFQVVS
jgi:hypothetical protein